MNQTATTPATAKTALKTYKMWVMKAHNAAIKAKAQEIEKEKHPEYIAAENMAKTALINLNRVMVAVLLLLCLSTGIKAQNATRTKDGNYIALTTSPKAKDAGKDTGKTFTDREGKKYPVLESSKGKLYYIRTSKVGNEYRCYIKTETK